MRWTITGAELRALRYGMCLDSAEKLATRLGVHPSTIYRNERRDAVTDYVWASVDVVSTARAFMSGIQTRED